MKNAALTASLHRRGLSQQDLADAIVSSRAHVCQVLAGKPGRGYRTRKKLAPLLTAYERELLGWDEHGNVFPVECSNQKKRPTPILDSFRKPMTSNATTFSKAGHQDVHAL